MAIQIWQRRISDCEPRFGIVSFPGRYWDKRRVFMSIRRIAEAWTADSQVGRRAACPRQQDYFGPGTHIDREIR